MQRVFCLGRLTPAPKSFLIFDQTYAQCVADQCLFRAAFADAVGHGLRFGCFLMLCGHGAFSFCNFLATANKGGNVAFFTSGAAFCNPARSAVILSWCAGALRHILHGKITNLFPKRRNGAREITGTAGKNCPPPVFRLILPKVVDDAGILSNRHKVQT